MATILIFALYLLATVAIGVWSAGRSTDSQEDYFLAGRKVSFFAMALSAVSSGRSAWLVVGASGAAWLVGLPALWLFPGYIFVEALLFVTVGPRLRARSIEMEALTVPEVLGHATRGPVGSWTHHLPIRPLGGVVVVVFLLTYVSAQLVAGGKALGTIFEVDGATWGLVITAGIVLVYTLLGGYRAVVITDVIQACLMLFGLVLLPILGLVELGGFSELTASLREIDPQLTAWSAGWLSLIGGLCIGLGSLGNPHILVRHMTLRDPSEARAAMWTGTFWNVVMAAGALLMGLVGRALYPDLASLGEGGREVLFPRMAEDLSTEFLFAGFVGFLLATLFAAIMSTCDSQLLVIAASALRDVLPRKPAPGRVGELRRSRVAVFLTLAAAVWLSFGESPLVLNLVLLSWFAIGIGFGPALLLLLYDRRTTALGVSAAIATGVLGICGFWYFFLRETGEHVSWHGGVVFAVSLAVGWSLRSRARA